MTLATDQPTARHYWATPYAFEPFQGGLGASLACTTSTASVALNIDPDYDPMCLVIFNVGDVFAHVRLGDSSVVATIACMAVPPGGALTINFTSVNVAIPTYIAGITETGTTRLQITTGLGGI